MAGLLIWKTYDLQFNQAERITSWGEQHRLRTIYTMGMRGNILDRTGEVLATSFSGANIFADPSLVTDPLREAEILAPILNMEAEAIAAKLSSPGQFVYLQRTVNQDLAELVEELDLDGIATQQASRRHYSLQESASEVVGRVGDYEQGISGIEAKFNDDLLGSPGEIVQEQYPGGRSIPGGISKIKPAVNGADIRLTIDRLMQFEAARILAEQVDEVDALGGALMVSRPRTGEILAMVSADRNEEGNVVVGQQNRSLTWVFEPGSVMKGLTFSAVLDSGLGTPSSVTSVPDRLVIYESEFSDYNPHPVLDYSLAEILVKSSNIGTIQWAQRLGSEALESYLRNFGLGRLSGLDLPGESAGLLEQARNWSGTSLPTIAIGQGVSVTPIQLLFAFNVIANDGLYVPARLVSEVVEPDGDRWVPPSTVNARRVFDEEVGVLMRGILRDAVRIGTGKRAEVPNYEPAGKTGTARKPLPWIGYGEEESQYKYVAAFVGFLPASNPEVSILVVIDEPSATIYGGTAAAPAFKEMGEIAMRRLRIPPPANDPEPLEAQGPEAGGPEVRLASVGVGDD